MSHEATNWAIKQRGLKPAAKIVLWHLCDRYHPDYGCFPSQETLANDCEMSRSALNEHLSALQEVGLIRREQRKSKSKRQQSTRYRFAFEADFQSEPCPENGHGAVSGFPEKPCPENDDSRVRISDTNPVIEPVINNLERDAHECANKSDLDFQNSFARWPTYASDSAGEAETAWEALTPEDRSKAIDRLDDYLLKAQSGGRTTICSFGKYLSERRFDRVAPKPTVSQFQAQIPQVQGHSPYSPEWFAKRMALLLDGPVSAMPRPSSFIAMTIEQGGELGERLRLEHICKYGFPSVRQMDSRAAINQSAAIEPEFVSLSGKLEPVNIESPLGRRWLDHFQSQGWPFAQGSTPVVYLPKGGPSAINQFKQVGAL